MQIRKRVLLVVKLLLALSLLGLVGCQRSPQCEVDNYDKIKEELKTDLPDIIFPDISRYEASNSFTYGIDLNETNRSLKVGYFLVATNFQVSPILCSFSVSSVLKDYYLQHLDYLQNLDGTAGMKSMEYRTITIYYNEGEETDWYVQNGRLGDASDSLFPEGTRVGGFSYVFDIKEYRYLVSGETALLSSESDTVTFEERMEQGREELFLIIDDILDQGGLPR